MKFAFFAQNFDFKLIWQRKLSTNEKIFFNTGLSSLALISIYEIPAVIPRPKGIRIDILEIALIEDIPGNT